MCPLLFDGVDDSPGAFDFVVADEEGEVAEDGVEEEAFVGFGGIAAEGDVVVEGHLGGCDAGDGAGGFGVDEQRDALVRLDAEDEDVVLEVFFRGGEEDAGRDLGAVLPAAADRRGGRDAAGSGAVGDGPGVGCSIGGGEGGDAVLLRG